MPARLPPHRSVILSALCNVIPPRLAADGGWHAAVNDVAEHGVRSNPLGLPWLPPASDILTCSGERRNHARNGLYVALWGVGGGGGVGAGQRQAGVTYR